VGAGLASTVLRSGGLGSSFWRGSVDYRHTVPRVFVTEAVGGAIGRFVVESGEGVVLVRGRLLGWGSFACVPFLGPSVAEKGEGRFAVLRMPVRISVLRRRDRT